MDKRTQWLRMGRVNATVRDEHLAQLGQVKESADSDISDAEAVRRIFDRAQRVDSFEQELRNKRAGHEQELAELCNEYETRITDLEQDVERLRNEKRTLITDREERTELVEYVQEQREVENYRARRERQLDQANIFTRTKWKLTGVPVDE